MEADTNLDKIPVPVSEALPEVEPRGEYPHVDKGGMTHFFETPDKRADFIAAENNPDNK